MMGKDAIDLDAVGSLYGLFLERVRLSPDAIAYRYFDHKTHRWQDISWQGMSRGVARWQAALRNEGLAEGDTVALMISSCIEWVQFEQAALGLGLVVIPLYANDRADNVAYILRDANVRVLLIEDDEQWQAISEVKSELDGLDRFLALKPIENVNVKNFFQVDDWLPETGGELANSQPNVIDKLATIVYTSGTTGRPKGVMLSHRNILWNAHSSLQTVDIYAEDIFLSFLPLSHTLERTIGYYLPMMAGSTVAYARSIPHLAEDLIKIKPTVLISVPRIFERVLLKLKSKLAEQGGFSQFMFNSAVSIGWDKFQHEQGRVGWKVSFFLWPIFKKLVAGKLMAKLGGRLRVAVVGGAPLSEDVGKVFIGLGLPLIQGYGLTETSPVISVNRIEDNVPASVGTVIPGVEVKVDDKDQLLTRSPAVMLGYWNLPEATAEILDDEGWLNTGDKAKIEDGYIFITGRTKDIIVLANGEKIPPADMEAAILMDALFEQVLVLGESRPYLTALVVLNDENKAAFYHQFDSVDDENERKQKIKHAAMERLCDALKSFPGYAQVRNVLIVEEPWTVENEMITPTLKVKRNVVMSHYQSEIEALYHGH